MSKRNSMDSSVFLRFQKWDELEGGGFTGPVKTLTIVIYNPAEWGEGVLLPR